MTAIRIVIVASEPLFRAGVIYSLNAEGGFEVVGEGSTAKDAVRLAKETAANLIVLDMNMTGGGTEVIKSVLAHSPEVRPLMLTDKTDNEQVCAAMQSGAWGYVMKGISSAELVQTLRIIHRGERYVTPALAAQLFAKTSAYSVKADADRFASLSGREEQILALLAEGLSNKEIGGRLKLSEKTIKHYLTIILDKLNVRNRVQAALFACNRRNRSRT